IADRPDDERDMVNRRGTEVGIGTSRDDLAFHDRYRLGDEPAVFVDPDQALGVPARGHHVGLDPPRAAAFPEIKGAAVDSSFPLLRRIRADPPGIHGWLASQPGGDRILLALVSHAQLRGLGAVPPRLPASRLGNAAVLVPGAPAVEAITMLRR